MSHKFSSTAFHVNRVSIKLGNKPFIWPNISCSTMFTNIHETLLSNKWYHSYLTFIYKDKVNTLALVFKSGRKYTKSHWPKLKDFLIQWNINLYESGYSQVLSRNYHNQLKNNHISNNFYWSSCLNQLIYLLLI